MAALAEGSLASSTPYKSKAKKLCVEEVVVSAKKHDESELEEGELRDSRLTNTTLNDYTFRSTSWVEILKEEEDESSEMQRSSSVKIEASDTNDSQSQSSYKREIAIEILDASNEAKFDRLLKEDKIKSPFRRHASNETFDEATRAELIKHDPSILDFKVDMSNVVPLGRTMSGQSDTACDGFNFPQSNPSTNSPGKRKRDNQTGSECSDDAKKPRFHKLRSESTSSSEQNFGPPHRPELETDAGTLARRQKQIDYGKNTIGYDNYMTAVPKDKRSDDDPRTPPKHLKYSRRAWDGLVKKWRKQLHKYDPNAQNSDDEKELY